MAGDTSNGDAVTITDLAREAMQGHYVTAVPETTEIFGANDNSGQVIFTGDDHVAVRSYSGTGNAANDGLCIYSTGNCYNFTGARRNAAEGMAISGGKHLWVAESADGSILHVPVSNPSATGASIYLNLTLRRVPATEYLHGPGNGGTATIPTGVGRGCDWKRLDEQCGLHRYRLHARQLYVDGDRRRGGADHYAGFGADYQRKPGGHGTDKLVWRGKLQVLRRAAPGLRIDLPLLAML